MVLKEQHTHDYLCEKNTLFSESNHLPVLFFAVDKKIIKKKKYPLLDISCWNFQ